MIQLEFNELTEVKEKLYICNTCNSCLNSCKVYCISKDSILYCKKYKKS